MQEVVQPSGKDITMEEAVQPTAKDITMDEAAQPSNFEMHESILKDVQKFERKSKSKNVQDIQQMAADVSMYSVSQKKRKLGSDIDEISVNLQQLRLGPKENIDPRESQN